jgi:hypothetical protein
MLENCKMALREMGAKWSDKIEIDTTHFICTTPAGPGGSGPGASPVGSPGPTVGLVDGVAPGVLYQRAVQLSIPVLQPGWILACHTEQRCVSLLMILLRPYILIINSHAMIVGWSQYHNTTSAPHHLHPNEHRAHILHPSPYRNP